MNVGCRHLQLHADALNGWPRVDAVSRCIASASNKQSDGSRRSEVLRLGVTGTTFAVGRSLLAPNAPNSQAAELELSAPTLAVGPDQALMRTLNDSVLAVARYPAFRYNATGGGGMAKVHTAGDRLCLQFDPSAVSIPPVDSSTATFLGLPLIPPCRIRVEPTRLEGFINRASGEAELEFEARFLFTAGPLYQAPPLLVTTRLTTEAVQGTIRNVQGSRLDKDGYARLVGLATVDVTHDFFLDKFLQLPTEVAAEMASQFIFDADTRSA